MRTATTGTPPIMAHTISLHNLRSRTTTAAGDAAARYSSPVSDRSLGDMGIALAGVGMGTGAGVGAGMGIGVGSDRSSCARAVFEATMSFGVIDPLQH